MEIVKDTTPTFLGHNTKIQKSKNTLFQIFARTLKMRLKPLKKCVWDPKCTSKCVQNALQIAFKYNVSFSSFSLYFFFFLSSFCFCLLSLPLVFFLFLLSLLLSSLCVFFFLSFFLSFFLLSSSSLIFWFCSGER